MGLLLVASAGQDDGFDGVVGLEVYEQLLELRINLEGERVQRRGSIQSQDRDAVVAHIELKVETLVGHESLLYEPWWFGVQIVDAALWLIPD